MAVTLSEFFLTIKEEHSNISSFYTGHYFDSYYYLFGVNVFRIFFVLQCDVIGKCK